MVKEKTTQPTLAQGIVKERWKPGQGLIWICVAGGVFLILWLVMISLLSQSGQAHGMSINNGIKGMVIFSNPGQEHREDDVPYEKDVPVGGAHNPAWLNCGIYNEPVRDEYVVHSLEHGAIWLAYRPDLPANQVETLRDLVSQENQRLSQPFLILASKPGLDVPIAVTAWQMQLKLDDASDERLVQFLRRYRRGLFTPEPEGGCTDSVGNPLAK